MSRSKEYEIGRVRQKAMTVFWENGFEATSVQDLVEATGLNRYSMYDAFGSKEGVFQAALDNYRDQIAAMMLATLDDTAFSGLEAIRHFLKTLKTVFSGPQGGRGCLFINSAVEAPLLEAASQERVTAHLVRLEKRLHHRLKEAAAAGEISATANTLSLARALVAMTLGSGVLARSPLARKNVTGAITGALALIDGLEV